MTGTGVSITGISSSSGSTRLFGLRDRIPCRQILLKRSQYWLFQRLLI